MGESSDTPLKLQFDRRVRLEFRGATITSDAGLLPYGECCSRACWTVLAGYVQCLAKGREILTRG